MPSSRAARAGVYGAPRGAASVTSSCHLRAQRTEAGKYAAKAEKHYYIEAQRDSVRDFLKCRTIGVRGA
jgi:hypothetical protein